MDKNVKIKNTLVLHEGKGMENETELMSGHIYKANILADNLIRFIIDGEFTKFYCLKNIKNDIEIIKD